MSESNKPQFPAWVSVVVNILIALALVGSFLYFYVKGNMLAWSKTGTADWPSSDPLLETFLTGVGGIMAAVFAVALNLPRSPIPRRFKTLTASLSNVLSFVPMPANPKSALASVEEVPGTSSGGGGGGNGGGNGNERWNNLNTKALVVFGTVLVISYVLLTMMSAITKIFFSSFAPRFVLDFAGAGMGVLVAAFAVWTSQITKGR